MAEALTLPDLRAAFPHTAELIVHGHPTLHDVDFDPSCGYVSQEEAWLLYMIAATRLRGRWLEIGAHTGWSAAHVAAAGWAVTAVDPRFNDPGFYARTVRNIVAAGVRDRIVLYQGTSEQRLTEPRDGRLKFDGAFIDGDHTAPGPLRDVQLLLPWLAPDPVIVFHDAVGQPVVDAIEWTARRGFQVHTYDTMAKLTVCWKGAWTPPELPL